MVGHMRSCAQSDGSPSIERSPPRPPATAPKTVPTTRPTTTNRRRVEPSFTGAAIPRERDRTLDLILVRVCPVSAFPDDVEPVGLGQCSRRRSEGHMIIDDEHGRPHGAHRRMGRLPKELWPATTAVDTNRASAPTLETFPHEPSWTSRSKSQRTQPSEMPTNPSRAPDRLADFGRAA